jgi:hypothetical protein
MFTHQKSLDGIVIWRVTMYGLYYGGRFVKNMITSSIMISPRWLLRPPFWIWFQSIGGQTPGLIDPIFLWLIGGD